MKKNLTELVVGDVIVDPQGRRHSVTAAVTQIVDEDGDIGYAIPVSYVSEVCGGQVFDEVREVFPVKGPETIIFNVEER